jgi:uncharacterized membrane protein YgcG
MAKKSLLIVLLGILLATVAFSQEAFEIDFYHIDMEVRENNSYVITENIILTFLEQRRGIVREIPLAFDKSPVKIHSVSVKGHDYQVTRDRENLNIRIGNPDIFLSGQVEYIISYVYDVGADRLKDMDEFNHNLIGPEWDTVIKDAGFSIRMPKPFNPGQVNCTSGPYGSTDNTGVEWSVEGITIKGRLTRPLQGYEGLTVALPLPEGYWVGARRHLPPLKNLLSGYPLYALMLFLSWLFWYRRGRDNKIIPVIEFDPPEGYNPAEIGYIVDGMCDSEDITALIIYWAHQGCLTIEEVPASRGKKTELVLTRVKDLNAEARPYEKTLFKKLFALGKDGRVTMEDLTCQFYKPLGEAQSAVPRFFSQDPERAVFQSGNENVKAGCLSISSGFIAGIPAFIPLFLMSLEVFRVFELNLFLRIILGFFVPIFVVGPFATLGKHLSLKGAAKKKEIVIAAIFGLVSSSLFGIVSVLIAGIPLVQYVAAVVTTMICSFFIYLMSRRTAYGDQILARVLGFREFIEKAEKDKLEKMFASDPRYYFNVLPYAIVLRLSSQWASHFEGMTMEPPSWYRGYRYDRFNTRDFDRHFNRSFSALSSTLRSAPSSSGSGSGSSGSSSSGGFSGGGSGGGGGHSW